MSKVALVTDSTAYLPPQLVDRYHISVTPLVLIWGQETFRDDVDIKPDQFYSRLEKTTVVPTTTQPSPAVFSDIFKSLLDQDYSVLAVLISAKLSGTMQSALQAQEALHSDRVAVVDSTTTAMAMGFQVLLAARAAEQGATLAECVDLVERNRNNTGIMFVVDTLKYLHMGGRIGGGTRFLGTALNLKPILELVDGRVEAIQRVVSKRKAVDRILDLVEQRIAGRTPVHISSLHAKAPEESHVLIERAVERFHPVEAYETDVSPVVGVHAGPGTVGLAFLAGI